MKFIRTYMSESNSFDIPIIKYVDIVSTHNFGYVILALCVKLYSTALNVSSLSFRKEVIVTRKYLSLLNESILLN